MYINSQYTNTVQQKLKGAGKKQTETKLLKSNNNTISKKYSYSGVNKV